MKVYAVNAGHFKLDGGAMFGVVPKSIWNKLNPADANNMCSWAMRCLLIEDGKRLILVDNGVGNKQDDKFFSYYYLHGEDTLEKSLRRYGFTANDITDVILTHLHFDHCGGSIEYNSDKSKLQPAFKNAIFYSNEKHWNWAVQPNAREKASFLKENILPIQESGQLKFLDPSKEFAPGISFLEVNGHTESMMLPLVKQGQNTLAYMADLIPSSHHLPLPYVMAYDTRPLETLKEKQLILNRALEENWTLMFEHDPAVECVQLERTERGIRAKMTLRTDELNQHH
ncbi:MAG TPA: MBL fold metallo-hydrolase [Bacteroidia bacterium]|nr:MBL fold metallo-hydrolase [Bacteroidia bacterium]